MLAVTFGLSAYTALLNLIEAVLLGLSGQIVALNPRRSPFDLIDLGLNLAWVFQLLAWGAAGRYTCCGAAVLVPPRSGWAEYGGAPDVLGGLGLAVLIGLPGLAFYLFARVLGIERIRGARRALRHLVAHPRAASRRVRQRMGRGSHRRRIPADPAAPAPLQPRPHAVIVTSLLRGRTTCIKGSAPDSATW